MATERAPREAPRGWGVLGTTDSALSNQSKRQCGALGKLPDDSRATTAGVSDTGSSDGHDYPVRRRIASSGARRDDGYVESRGAGGDARRAEASPGGGSAIRIGR